MEPPPFGDGKRSQGCQTVCRGQWFGFNGATAFRRWKVAARLEHPGGGIADCQASMEPPPFGDGKLANRTRGCRRSSGFATAFRPGLSNGLPGQFGFNGATAFRRWKAASSHDGRRYSLSCQASMEPPPFGDGKPVSGGVISPALRHQLLQWSHRLSAMERDTTMTGVSVVAPLQWATAFRRWKVDECLECMAPKAALQWSHRLSAMESCRW